MRYTDNKYYKRLYYKFGDFLKNRIYDLGIILA